MDYSNEDISTSKAKRKPSTFWKFFERSENSAMCKICHATIKTSGNTTNLKQHMKRSHKTVDVQEETQQQGKSPIVEYYYVESFDKKPAIKNSKASRRKNASPIWGHYIKTDSEKVLCKWCNTTLKCKSTTSLFRHLRLKHADVSITDTDYTEETVESEDVDHQEMPNDDALQSAEARESLRPYLTLDSSSKGTKRPIVSVLDAKNYSTTMHGVNYMEISEYDAIGKNVAHKLARMRHSQFFCAETLINQVLRRGLMNTLSQETSLCEGTCGNLKTVDTQTAVVADVTTEDLTDVAETVTVNDEESGF